MPHTVTPRQKEIFEFLLDFIEERGRPPTIREIASHFRIVSLNAVRVHLKALEKKKFISLEKGCSRGITITRLEHGQPELPLVGKIAAGAPLLAVEHREDSAVLESSFWGSDKNLFLLRVSGDSMSPYILDGDLVVVKPQTDASAGDIVVALIDGEATVKKLMHRSGRIVLHPLNRAYEDMEPQEDVTINGKVVGVIRKL
jgi:repressor LexA